MNISLSSVSKVRHAIPMLALWALAACGGGGTTVSTTLPDPAGGTNAPTTVYVATPYAAGSVTGTNRVVANKSYAYSANTANGVAANVTWCWG
jgi:hypothetical protein